MVPIEEWKDVASWFFHGEQDYSVVLFCMIGQDGDYKVCVQRVQVPSRLVKQNDHGVPDQLNPYG